MQKHRSHRPFVNQQSLSETFEASLSTNKDPLLTNKDPLQTNKASLKLSKRLC